METDNFITKEICELHRINSIAQIEDLEKRIFAAIKQAMIVSNMSHAGNKESLQSLITTMQEDAYGELSKFEKVDKKINSLEKLIDDLDREVQFFVIKKENIDKIEYLSSELKLIKLKLSNAKKNLEDDLHRTDDTLNKTSKYIKIALAVLTLVLGLHVITDASLKEMVTYVISFLKLLK